MHLLARTPEGLEGHLRKCPELLSRIREAVVLVTDAHLIQAKPLSLPWVPL
ncbi:hypothetical protein DAD186_02630 [Dermabacter vaginalis]|uniref:Uncharacterized protein n=1 Tax=Dermabacter vaginalis TaxID=1630135 RepID=A0A1B0ZFX7_9MICO|nr:hypothetical protein DAD186_02630 [Dermabacter vaginalis]